MKPYLAVFALVFTTFLLSGCGQKPTATVTPTPTPRVFELKNEEKPLISLIPRPDGHLLKLKIDKIPASVKEIEYELLYTATDGGLEIEKGLGDTIKINSTSISRDLLLGTESCTSGCKYKYDNGVSTGSLSLTFINQSQQLTTFHTDFVFKSYKDIQKEGQLTLKSANHSEPITKKAKPTDYFLLLQNYSNPQEPSSSQPFYSLFDSSQYIASPSIAPKQTDLQD
jgi:hypothetical protein